jgi:hypothetical protein
MSDLVAVMLRPSFSWLSAQSVTASATVYLLEAFGASPSSCARMASRSLRAASDLFLWLTDLTILFPFGL